MKTILPLLVFSALATLSSACTDAAAPRKLARTKAPCADNTPQRKAYFGDLHVHTSYSFDAQVFDTTNDPAAAYRFAKGEELMIPPLDADGKGTQKVRLARPLDFAAVTDHSEYLGEVDACLTPGAPGYDSHTCKYYRLRDMGAFTLWGLGLTVTRPKRFFDVCGPDGGDCAGPTANVWKKEIQAAEDAYDWSPACRFTSFIAYEYTAVPGASNLHRNVIFKNNHVPSMPISLFEESHPAGLWQRLEDECKNGSSGCDVLTIPHNSNLSNGNMFFVETEGSVASQRAAAKSRAAMEPLVEIFQHKGDSECMNGLSGTFGQPDELCGFEKILPATFEDCGDKTGTGGMAAFGCVSRNDYVRGALLNGMAAEERLGINPFEMGIIASTDTHNSTPGFTDEAAFAGHTGSNEDTVEKRLAPGAFPAAFSLVNPGGLAGVWADENSRDSIFDALRRRETFGTSGTRMTVRFFGGWTYGDALCADAGMVQKGYDGGVPMGGVLPAQPSGVTAPTFLVSALADPGTATDAGTPLQRLQIIKGWIENGERHEKVFDVAGNPANGAAVDANCKPTGAGAASLCRVWADPEFNPGERAFYYLRAVENPTCRWSQRQCLSLPEAKRPSTCDAESSLTKTVQERAWSSPIWYKP